MRAIYVPAEDWDNFFKDQAVKSGHGIPGFEGIPYQRGGGLGNFLGRLFRSVLPVLKKVGKAVGKQALATGADIMADVARGRNIKESAQEHGRAGLADLADKAGKNLRGHGQLGTRARKKNTTKPIKRKAKPGKKRQPKKKRTFVLKNVETY